MVYFVNCPNGSLQHFVPGTIYRPNVLGCHPHYTPIEENGKKRVFIEFYYDLVIETLGPVRKSGNHPPSVAHFLRHFTAVITFIPRITRKPLITWDMVLSDKLTFSEVTKTSLLIIESYLTGRSQKVKINGSLSSSRNDTSGVPQESIVGSLSFVFMRTICLTAVVAALHFFALTTRNLYLLDYQKLNFN